MFINTSFRFSTADDWQAVGDYQVTPRFKFHVGLWFIRRHRWKRFRPIATHVIVCPSVSLRVLSSVTLVLKPRWTERNEMLFGSDTTRVVPRNVCIHAHWASLA